MIYFASVSVPSTPASHPTSPTGSDDVFRCAREAFAFEESRSSRLHEFQFEPRRVYCGLPSHSHSTFDPRLPPSFLSSCLLLASEFQYKFTPSETEEQPKPENSSPPRTGSVPKPEPESTRSIAPSLSTTTSLMLPCAEVVPELDSVPSVIDDFDFAPLHHRLRPRRLSHRLADWHPFHIVSHSRLPTRGRSLSPPHRLLSISCYVAPQKCPRNR